MCEGNCNNEKCGSYSEAVRDNCCTFDTGRLREMCNDFVPEKPQAEASNSSDGLCCPNCDLLMETLEDLLPHIECRNTKQSNVITRIGLLIEQWKEGKKAT